MFKLRKVDSSPLLSSKLYDERSFYTAFSKDFKQARHEVIIESPYITKRRSSELAPLCKKLSERGVNVKILTRNPDHHDSNLRAQAWIGIKILRDAGVRVFSCDDLRHRKIAVIDDEILWEGSLNMLSHSNSRELMRRTQSKELCEQIFKFTSVKRDLKWYNYLR